MKRSLSLLLFGALVLTACEGEPGLDGEVGATGQAGENGAPCFEGLDDQNGDGVVDQLDCFGEDGTDG